MGMKANSGHFVGTNGYKSYFKINIQLFSNKKISKTGERYLKKATDLSLKNTIRELYRPGANVGDGGTADAIRKEIKTGIPVGGRSHIIKGKERLKNLENIINKKELSRKDKLIAIKLYKDLKKALEGK